MGWASPIFCNDKGTWRSLAVSQCRLRGRGGGFQGFGLRMFHLNRGDRKLTARSCKQKEPTQHRARVSRVRAASGAVQLQDEDCNRQVTTLELMLPVPAKPKTLNPKP